MTTENLSVTHQPYIPAAEHCAEFTLKAIVLGILLGIVFGASSLYLVLKVGLTVSASIPVAVIAITLFRLFAKFGVRDSTILENTIVSTAGSAGESIAFGLGVTMPAILILGFDLEITRVLLVAVLGGLLGIFMMIPLRRTLIVAHHRELKYPEGTACAQVLIAAEASKASGDAKAISESGAVSENEAISENEAVSDNNASSGNRVTRETNAVGENKARAAVIFTGFFIGLIYKIGNVALKGWKDVISFKFGAPLNGGSIAAEISPELLGVGYIIGPRIAATMCAGGVLAYLLLIPLIKFFGDSLALPLAPATKLIRDMGASEIRGAYILYIGAGAVAAGGLISLLRALPTIWHSLRDSLSDKRARQHGMLRTESDIPMKWVLLGCLAIITVISIASPLHMNVIGASLILLCGFLFVTVSARLTGEIGQSSNPVSGMTIATLLLTCLIFLLLGWTAPSYYVTALSVGAIVCIACANGGATSQDLKTGYLVGSTPRLQQYAIICGALVSAVALGPILLKLNDAATVYVPAQQVAPSLHIDPKILTTRESLTGPQAASDSNTYFAWHKTDSENGPAGKYLIDENGAAKYFVDPGINGLYTTRPDGSEVRKFDAPKAVLVSYLIKGILDRELPWELVIFGVIIALVLEMCGIASLPFAVGVYLPISSSVPLFIGGAIRWFIDWSTNRRRERDKTFAALSQEEKTAESDRSKGVLLASGYIAGGALAGIVIAFSAGLFSQFDTAVANWAEQGNVFYAGSSADALSLLPYLLLAIGLLFVGRNK